MSDPKKPTKPNETHAPRPRLGGDQQAADLGGIAPKVMDAFLNAYGTKPKPQAAPPPEPAPDEPEPVEAPSPRDPPSLGRFPAMDPDALKARQMKIHHLAAMLAEQPGGLAAPLPPPPRPRPRTPSGPLGGSPPGSPPADDLRAKHLSMRKPPAPGAPRPGGTGRLHGTGSLGGTGSLPPPGADLRQQHLQLRREQLGGGLQPPAQPPAQPPGPRPPRDTGKLQSMVESALGAEGAMALRSTVAALEDAAMPAKLTALTAAVNDMVPGADGVMKLGADVGKRMIVNNLNPVLALSIAAKESAEKIDTLKKWESLTPKERMAAAAGLSANLAEILGAVTPPPVSFGVQVAAAGLSLVSLATDHAEVFEDAAALATKSETGRKVAGELSDRGAVIAHQVKQAWGELGERLDRAKKQRPRAPQQLQQLFDSEQFQGLKDHQVTKNLATGFENLTYNLTNKWDAQRAKLEQRLGKMKKKKEER